VGCFFTCRFQVLPHLAEGRIGGADSIVVEGIDLRLQRHSRICRQPRRFAAEWPAKGPYCRMGAGVAVRATTLLQPPVDGIPDLNDDRLQQNGMGHR
jgi:hypothetical protein